MFRAPLLHRGFPLIGNQRHLSNRLLSGIVLLCCEMALINSSRSSAGSLTGIRLFQLPHESRAATVLCPDNSYCQH